MPLTYALANDASSTNLAKKSYIDQPLPALPKSPAPKIKKIIFNAYSGIDPIVTGPRG